VAVRAGPGFAWEQITMTRDDMIRMAREAGWEYADNDPGFEPLWAFAALVAQHEREACAKVAEEGLIGHTIAKAIRARGNA
jgi:hypothetical protein